MMNHRIIDFIIMKKKKLGNLGKDEKEPLSKEKVLKTVLIIASAIFSSFVLNLTLQAILNTKSPLLVVISDSMEPNISQGDLIIIRGIDPEHIKSPKGDRGGDIIVFDAHGLWEGAPDELIVHRVFDKFKKNGRWYFYTKGDANWHIDLAPIPENRVIGVVIAKIPYVGWVKIVLIDWGFVYAILIIYALLVANDIIKEKLKDVEKSKNKKVENIELNGRKNEN